MEIDKKVDKVNRLWQDEYSNEVCENQACFLQKKFNQLAWDEP